MSLLIQDVLDGSITPQKSNAVVNATGKMLKVVEMEIRHGKVSENGTKVLQLSGEGS